MGAVAVVEKLSGSACAIRSGVKEPLNEGSSLRDDDVLATETDSRLEIRFADGSFVHLGPSSRVEIKDFAFEAGQPNSFVLHMMEGAVRSVSGKIVEQSPEAFKLTSPMGTVGIRGTETMHLINSRYEVHAVTSLEQGHSVIIQTNDGRVVVISDTMKGVIITLGSTTPLEQLEVTPQMLEEYFKSLTSEGRLHSTPQSFLVATDALLLAALGDTDLTGHKEFTPLGVGDLVAALDDLGAKDAARLIFEVLDGGQSFNTVYPSFYIGTSGNDTLYAAPAGANQLYGLQGDDLLTSYGGTDMLFGGYGSSDTLIKQGDMTDGNFFYGDGDDVADPVLAVTMTGVVCDSDVITVNGNMTGGEIYGDAYELINCTAGNDTITVTGNMSGGKIYADGAVVTGGMSSYSNGITIGGILSGGEIHLGGGTNTLSVGGFGDGGAITIDATPGAFDVNKLFFRGDVTASISNTGITVNGRAGEIALDASFTAFGGGTGAAVLDASSRTEGVTLYCGNGSNTLTGGSGADAIIGESMSSGTLDGGAGNDSVIIATLSGGLVGGGSGSNSIDITIMTGGAVTGTGTDNVTINVLSGTGAVNLNGDDTLNVTTMTGGTVTSTGSDDVTIATLSGAGVLNLNGDDTLHVTTMNGGTVNLHGATVDVATMNGGTINYDGTSSGSVASMINGALVGGSGGDGITFGSMSAGSAVGGGGDDTITLTGTMYGSMGVYIAGDAYTLNGIGGNDSMNINTIDVTAGGGAYICGDAMWLSGTGGNDTIVVGTATDSVGEDALIYGDANTLTGATICGNDSITVTTMTQGQIFGDFVGMQNASFAVTQGNDTISVTTLINSDIYADSQDGNAINSTPGQNVITVGTSDGSWIYGGRGDDSITIGTCISSVIEGGGGNDTISIGTMSGLFNSLHFTEDAGGGENFTIQNFLTGSGSDVVYLNTGDVLRIQGATFGVVDATTLTCTGGGGETLTLRFSGGFLDAGHDAAWALANNLIVA